MARRRWCPPPRGEVRPSGAAHSGARLPWAEPRLTELVAYGPLVGMVQGPGRAAAPVLEVPAAAAQSGRHMWACLGPAPLRG